MTAPTVSKKAIAGNIFKSMTAAGARRKDIVFTMCEQAGLSEAGASTYYNNFKTGLWKIAVPTEIAAAIAPVATVLEAAAPAVTEVAELGEVHVELTDAEAVAPVVISGDDAPNIFGEAVFAHLSGLMGPDEDEEEEEEDAVAIDYTEMTKAELVKLYNSKSEKQVKDFRDHATAVRRVTELFTAV